MSKEIRYVIFAQNEPVMCQIRAHYGNTPNKYKTTLCLHCLVDIFWTVENVRPVLRWGWAGSIRKHEKIACWSEEMNE